MGGVTIQNILAGYCDIFSLEINLLIIVTLSHQHGITGTGQDIPPG